MYVTASLNIFHDAIKVWWHSGTTTTVFRHLPSFEIGNYLILHHNINIQERKYGALLFRNQPQVYKSRKPDWLHPKKEGGNDVDGLTWLLLDCRYVSFMQPCMWSWRGTKWAYNLWKSFQRWKKEVGRGLRTLETQFYLLLIE